EQRVGLIKEEDRVGVLRRSENAFEVLLSLPDVFANDGGQVDLVEIQFQLTRDDLDRHRLARPRRAGEERADPFAKGQLPVQPPLVHASAAMDYSVANLSELGDHVIGQYYVTPSIVRVDLLGHSR